MKHSFTNSFYKFLLATASICMLPSVCCDAQCIEKGKVMQYQGKTSKVVLGGVEILAANAGSTISGVQGDFSLNFKKLKAGDRVKIMRVEKTGYILFNKEAVDQWHISRTGQPFTIVMCKEERYREIRNNYERISSESYAKKMKAEENRWSALRKQNKLTEENYKKRLEQLHYDYETQLENLDTYIDRVSRYDLSELSEKENDIISLMQQGKVDEALSAYDEMNLEEKLEREINIIGSLSIAEDKLNKEAQDNRQKALQTYEAICRKNDILYLAGGSENIKKIKESMRKVAFADTTFTRAMVNYVLFLEKDQEYMEALDMVLIALRNSKDDTEQYSISLITGEILTNLGEFDEAEELYQYSYEFLCKIYKDEPELIAIYGGGVLEGMATLFFMQGKSKEAEDVYAQISELRNLLNETLGITYSMSDIMSDINRVRNLISRHSFDAAIDLAYKTRDNLEKLCKDSNKDFERKKYLSILYSHIASAFYQKRNFTEAYTNIDKSISLLEDICKTHFNEYAKALSEAYDLKGGILRATAKYYGAIDSYRKAIDMVDTLINIKPDNSNLLIRFRADVCSNLGNAYIDSKQYNECIKILKKALIDYEMIRFKSIVTNANYINAMMGLNNAYFNIGDNKNTIYYGKIALKSASEGYESAPSIFANLFTLSLYNYCRTVCLPSGDYSTGETLIKKAISIYEKKEVAHYDYLENSYYELAFLYQMQGKNKEAEDIINYGVKHFPNNLYFLDGKGELLMKEGKRQEAMDIWNKIISIDPHWASNGSDFSKMVLNNNK